MEIIGLVGESGSGKSYKAMMIAKENNIDYIIDDGILIKGTRVIAGKSAKREGTVVSAVKTAIFMDDNHKKDVINALNKENPERLLVIGTSDRMVEKIAAALNIGEISRKIYIEEISNKEEIHLAKMYRYKQGKHVIPVPTFEIKKDFSGYFLDTLKMLRKKDDSSLDIYEKTVVRPTFSYRGKYTIANKTLIQIVEHISRNTKGVYRPLRVKIENTNIGIDIKLEVILTFGEHLPTISYNLQEKIKEDIENMTGINVINIDIYIKGLSIKK